MGSDDKDVIVKKSLSSFIGHHLGIASLSSIDDIVLIYLAGILEDLGKEATADVFDMESFTEMMEAYLPGFSHIDRVEIYDWMFGLAASLAESQDAVPDKVFINFVPDVVSLVLLHPKESISKSKSEISHCDKEGENHDGDIKNLKEEITFLIEMFPKVCKLEVAQCLSLSNNDIEAAAQLILFRQEAGETILEQTPPSKIKMAPEDEKTLKENILQKYGYIDSEEDARTHRPVVPKTEPKKLVRYLDNKVVTTRGERFTQVKEGEEEDMKKTYISLKASRQYRFH